MRIRVPIKIVSESNIREHWAKKHRRSKEQKNIIGYYLSRIQKPNLPVKVKLIRIAPRKLDIDNLHSALKTARDTVADWLIPGLKPGRADGDERITFEVDQEKGKPKEYGLDIVFK